jgi:uncharacterized protein YjbI with pentapeptide repeats
MNNITTWNSAFRSKWPAHLRSEVLFTGGVDLRGPILEGGWLGRVKLSGCQFVDCDLGDPLLKKADIENCTFDRMSFGKAGAVWRDVRVTNSSIKKSSLKNISFNSCSVTNVIFHKTDIHSCKFRECEFIKCSFDDCDLSQVNFVDCRFSDTELSSSRLSDCALLRTMLGNSRWPDREDCFLVTISSLSEIAQLLKDNLPSSDLEAIHQITTAFANKQDPMIWSGSLIEDLSPNAGDLLNKELYNKRIRR